MKPNIGGILDISTIDFPKRVCSVIFFCGCPFRCPFCQNWRLFISENCKKVEVKQILSNFKSNFLIDAITITGGEPTLQIDALVELLNEIKSLGLATKIDTNGFFPDRIEGLLKNNLLDYVALDVKAPLRPEIYGTVVGSPNLGHEVVPMVKRSLEILIGSDIPLEVRTTIVPGLIEGLEEIENIARAIQGADLYVLQQFRSDGGTLDPKFKNLPSPPREELLKLAKVAKKYLSDVRIRTRENGEEKL